MKYKNPLAVYSNAAEKVQKYTQACKSGEFARQSDGRTVRLCDVAPDDVEFIGGMWRVQDDFKYDICTIRNRLMVLGERIAHTEKTFFEYYRAAWVGFNCYGPFVSAFDTVVAKYMTDDGTYWAYGANIAAARAFLGIRLYDEYMNMIHSVACKKTMRHQGK